MALEYLFQTFKKSPIFKSLNDSQIARIIQHLKVKRVPSGTKIITIGEMGDKFYILRDGVVEVRIKKGLLFTKKVAELHNGDCFGEMALIENRPRNATVIAKEDCELFTLDRTAFNELIMSNQKLRKKMETLVAIRKQGH